MVAARGPVVVVEDDPEDRELIEEAWGEIGGRCDLEFVRDGQQLLDLLGRRLPPFVILDLNLPVKDGREALREIRGREELRGLPVIALSTSSAEEDVSLVYRLGGAGYFVKPNSFDGLCAVARAIDQYWCRHAKWPPLPC